MIVKTRIFGLCNSSYGNLSELAQAMGISVSQVYRVREGTRGINQRFIVGAIRAFPHYRLDELFYLAPGSRDDESGKEARTVMNPESASTRDKYACAVPKAAINERHSRH